MPNNFALTFSANTMFLSYKNKAQGVHDYCKTWSAFCHFVHHHSTITAAFCQLVYILERERK